MTLGAGQSRTAREKKKSAAAEGIGR